MRSHNTSKHSGKVIVTGVAGFIGRHTLKALLQRGYEVIGVDIQPWQPFPSFPLHDIFPNPKFHYIECDVCDSELAEYIDEGNKVLHLAAVAKFGDAEENPQRAIRVNIEGTLNVVKACIEKKAERLVYSSTGSVYALDAPVPIREDAPRVPASIYGLSKKMAEDIIFFHINKLPYIVLRYAYIYGKGKDWGAVGAFIQKIREGKPPMVFGGKQTNDFVYVKDIVEANILALETDYLNQAYNIGTGRATSIRDVCETCIRAMNVDIEPEITPGREFDYPVFVYDISKAEVLLKFHPKWTLFDGVKDTLTGAR